jgi:hypothetical protein
MPPELRKEKAPLTPDQKKEARRERNRLRIAEKRASVPGYREQNRAYSRAYAASHREERRIYRKKYTLRRDYGLSWEEFDGMLKAQGGKCAICGVLMDPPARCTRDSIAVTVDHCHDTGAVRGLLCYSCNLGLGIFKDILRRVQAAARYLESAEGEGVKHGEENPRR